MGRTGDKGWSCEKGDVTVLVGMGTGDESKRKWECGKKEEQGTWGNEGVDGKKEGTGYGREGEEVVGRRRKRDRG